MPIEIRPIRAEDAAAVVAMQAALNRQEGYPTHHFTREIIARDVFGPNPFVAILVAVADGEMAGYALTHDCYESSHAARGAFVADLFVEPQARRKGVARALLARIAVEGKARGIDYLLWTSMPKNAGARSMYRAIGATEEPVAVHVVAGEAFERLAGRN
jgi:GNAT superfamily N-acetyltransferase